MKKTLNDLKLMQKGKVKKIYLSKDTKRRFNDLGIIKGTYIMPVLNSPFKSPRAFEIKGCVMAIRSEDAANIEIEEENCI